jgi:hypothetical protein
MRWLTHVIRRRLCAFNLPPRGRAEPLRMSRHLAFSAGTGPAADRSCEPVAAHRKASQKDGAVISEGRLPSRGQPGTLVAMLVPPSLPEQ